MPFTIQNKEHSVIKIGVIGTITLEELKKILAVLTRVFESKKPFAFFVHCNFNEVPSESTSIIKYLISWMKESHPHIIAHLQGSSLILKNETIVKVFNGIFKIKAPVKPNLITTDAAKAEQFVMDIMKNYLKAV